jgi:calcineurin-like phosphoesterase family protein
MNKGIIKNFNSKVTDNDTLYIIGDFAVLRKNNIYKIQPILEKLNGRKILILGNHDEGKPFTYIKMGFHSVHTSLEYEDMILKHDPFFCVDQNKKYLVGHTHKPLYNRNIFNVGVDVNNYYPVSYDTIEKYFKEFYV